jgi:hypothetical protein
MKKYLTPLLLFTVLLFPLTLLSCATGRGRGFWKNYPELPAYWDFRPGVIEVTVDQASEEEIAAQLGVIAETLLAADAPENIQIKHHWIIDINVEQRSFLYGAELLNTIYISCIIREENGRILGRENEYSAGKGSMVSAREQHLLLKRVLGRILKERQDRYREIIKQRKKAGLHDET